MFLKVPMIIIMRFGKNNVLWPNISIYINFAGVQEEHTWSTVHFLFIIKKKWKSKRAWPILKSNYTSFWFKKRFPRINNKKFMKRRHKSGLLFLYKVKKEAPISLQSEYSSSNWFHSNTHNFRCLFNTNNTNMYLIHYHSKNIIKKYFPKSFFF